MAFYFGVFALLIFNKKWLFGFGLVIGLVSAAYWLVGAALFPGFLQTHLWSRVLDLCLVHYGIYFGLGVVLFMRQGRFRYGDLAFLAIGLAASCVEISLKADDALASFGRPGSALAPILVFLIAFALAEAAFRMKVKNSTARLFRTLGIATYPFYLLHDVAGAAIIRWLVDLGANRWVALTTAITFIAVSGLIEPKVRTAISPFVKAMSQNLYRRQAATP